MMDEHLNYLNQRIESLKATHQELKEQEATLSGLDALFMNGLAAAAWDRVGDLENARENYLHTRPAFVANPYGDDNHAVPEVLTH